MYPIDAVVPWVDGNAPEMRAKRNMYVTPEQERNPDVAGPVRFASVGEIKYCVASMLKFMPFLRKIFIVTDGQDPEIDGFINEHFPDRNTRIEIVDHKVIFWGHEELLPVFNSTAIETYVWNIPDLSEHFIYMNDDFFMVAPAAVEDFFRGNKVVCYGEWYSVARHLLNRRIRPKKHGQEHVGFKDGQYNGLQVLGGGKRFIYLAHAPRPMLKSWYESFIPSHQKDVARNFVSKFRSPVRWNPQEAFYVDMYRKGMCKIINNRVRGLYVEPRKHKPYHMDFKIAMWNHHPDPLYLCANSLNTARPDELEKFMTWLRNRLGL